MSFTWHKNVQPHKVETSLHLNIKEKKPWGWLIHKDDSANFTIAMSQWPGVKSYTASRNWQLILEAVYEIMYD